MKAVTVKLQSQDMLVITTKSRQLVINRHNIDGKHINSTKHEMTLLLRRRLPWLMIELYLNNHSFTMCATFSEKATFIAH